MLLLSSSDFFQNYVFFLFFSKNKKKTLLETLIECQTVWIQIRTDENVGPDRDPNCLQN